MQFTEPALLEAFDIANTAGLPEEELELQFKRRDFILLQKGALEKAKKEGRKEGRKETAVRMLVDTLPLETIMKYTELTQEELERL